MRNVLLALGKGLSMNENPIEGMECPHCGNNLGFRIMASTFVEVTPNGVLLDNNTDFDWDKDAICECSQCKFVSTVDTFTLVFLDEDEDYNGYSEEDFL